MRRLDKIVVFLQRFLPLMRNYSFPREGLIFPPRSSGRHAMSREPNNEQHNSKERG